MAATAHPVSPAAQFHAVSAIQRTTQNGGTEEAKIKGKEELKERTELKQEEAKQESQIQKQTSRQASGASGDGSSVVDIPLDSPAQEQQPAFVMTSHKSDLSEDELKTPRLGSNTSGRSAPNSKGSLNREGRNSPSIWAGLIASAIDHPDENVTKRARRPLYPYIRY